jgi:Icc-related predicted phosphoesterase
MKLGFLTDLHFRNAVPGTSSIEKRRCRQMGDVLCRNLKLLKNEGVDLVVCGGDLVDEPDHPAALKDLAELRRIFDEAGVPTLVIPGNHDPHPDDFYKIFKRPDRVLRIGDIELITFCEDVPLTGAEDSERQDLAGMEKLFAKNSRDVRHTVVVQHYIIYPPIDSEYPYNYRNFSAIRAIMEESGRSIFSLSGHYHRGFDVIEKNGVSYFCGKAMCEEPFPCYTVDLSGDEIEVREL